MIISQNVGNKDSYLRTIVGAVLAVTAVSGSFGSAVSLLLGVLALILLLTAWTRFCPLYGVLGIRTCSFRKKTD